MMRLPLVLVLVPLALGCEREMRRFEEPPPASQRNEHAPVMSALLPGPQAAADLGAGQGSPLVMTVYDPYERNAWAVAEGKRLWAWYNCAGCHSNGGGGMAPPLMDRLWKYGIRPEDLFTTIVEGRPNGMPAFRGRIPEFQVWQLVAYVRSLSGQLRPDVAPGRGDHMSVKAPESVKPREQPMPAPENE